MDTWTRQMGYPLISIQPTDKDNSYVITQKRFFIDSKAVTGQKSEYGYISQQFIICNTNM